MKIVIFTAGLDFNVRWNVIALSEQNPGFEFTIMLQQPRKTSAQLLRNQFKNVRRHGWRWIPYQATEIGTILMSRLHSKPTRSTDEPGRMFSGEALNSHPRIQVKVIDALNSAASTAFVQQQGFDLGIALGAPLLKDTLFSVPRLGTINLHKGELPRYRGMPPAFWELKNGETSVGCTVHKVAAGLDTGDILLQSSVAVERYSTVAGMRVKLDRLGVQMVCQAVELIASGSPKYVKQPPGGATNSRPTLAQEAGLRAQLAAREPDAKKVLKRLTKNLLFTVYSHGLMPTASFMHGLLRRQRVIILLYHRVSDQFRDNVTVGIERFDQHMAYVAKHCVTVSLRDIVNDNIPRHSKKPVIAVSFDDGYLDNFENAAPILLKHQVPCTFFISTEKIRDNKPFDHDLRSLGFGLDNMNWEQVRQMQAWGFHFGSHTRNHVNLAEVDDEVALEELEGSLHDIRTQLGQEQVFIAFPYGRKKHITPARIDLMKQVGYDACFSAYGGLNDTMIDRFNIKRIGINWAFDLPALKARLQGWDRTQ